MSKTFKNWCPMTSRFFFGFQAKVVTMLFKTIKAFNDDCLFLEKFSSMASSSQRHKLTELLKTIQPNGWEWNRMHDTYDDMIWTNAYLPNRIHPCKHPQTKSTWINSLTNCKLTRMSLLANTDLGRVGVRVFIGSEASAWQMSAADANTPSFQKSDVGM